MIPQLREIAAFWIINFKHKRFSSIKIKAAHFVDPSFLFVQTGFKALSDTYILLVLGLHDKD